MQNSLALAVEDQLITQELLGIAVGRCLGIFNTNYGMARSWYPEWLQGALNMLIILLL